MGFIRKISPDLMRAASRVARAVQLEQVQLINLSLALHPAGKLNAREEYLVDIAPKYDGFETKEGELRVNVRIIVAIFNRASPNEEPSETKKKKPDAIIEVGYCLIYGAPRGSAPKEVEEKEIPAFAEVNGIYHAWPYMREYVHRITTDMGMPVLNFSVKEPEQPAKSDPAAP